ncbi:MAG: ABC transporter permease subunit [Brevinema sp.]
MSRIQKYHLLKYLVLISSVVFSLFPIWIGFTASTLSLPELIRGEVGIFKFGDDFFKNYHEILFSNVPGLQITASRIFWNTIFLALVVTFGKLIISIFSAYAIVFFRIPFENFFFWLIFMTLMLPVEIRLVPSFKLIVDLQMIGTPMGVVLPLIASATATFLLRQFFMTIPKEYIEAAIMDKATPWKFLKDILFPMSKNTLIALFIITFIGAWHQYLWPLLVGGDSPDTLIINVALKNMLSNQGEGVAPWHHILALSCLAMIPPMILIFSLQKYYITGISNSEK